MTADGGLLILMMAGPAALVVLGITAALERFGPEHPPRWFARLMGD